MPTPVTLLQKTSSRKSPRPTTLLAMKPSEPSTTRFVVKVRWVAWASVVGAAVAASIPVLAVLKALILAICLEACSVVAAAALAVSSADLARRAADADPKLGAALAPYPLWCGFATVLSGDIWRLNR